MNRKLISKAIFLTFFCPLGHALASDPIYLYVKGQKQGEIKGGVVVKGHPNEIEVLSVSQEIMSPTDTATGLGTGKRTHTPVVVCVPLESSSPLLMNALTTNEVLTDVELKFDREVSGGVQSSFNISLTNAHIVSISLKSPSVGDVNAPSKSPYLQISFTFQKIAWNSLGPVKTSAADDWVSAN